MEYSDLVREQRMSLEEKVEKTREYVKSWYESWDGDVKVSFSGGKDSTVLLHICRELYPDIEAVFSNTGLEWPEIVKFVDSNKNVIKVKPRYTFGYVIDRWGYPVVSKEVSHKIQEVRTTKSEKLLRKRLSRGGVSTDFRSGRLPVKWRYLINSPFKISSYCCDVLKKQPLARHSNLIVGTMAEDSMLRRQKYLRYGCVNMYDQKKPMSYPMMLWTGKDVWEYIRSRGVKYSKIYDMGYKSTGCMFCMFGVHLEHEPNRFQMMQKTHPKLWNYCINKLDLRTPLEYINVSYEWDSSPFAWWSDGIR
jgi:3'-phosphoadenosine 5'-phosphosulfate sulfotransferase (PAPS reductase)/FAD synthetase